MFVNICMIAQYCVGYEKKKKIVVLQYDIRNICLMLVIFYSNICA